MRKTTNRDRMPKPQYLLTAAHLVRILQLAVKVLQTSDGLAPLLVRLGLPAADPRVGTMVLGLHLVDMAEILDDLSGKAGSADLSLVDFLQHAVDTIEQVSAVNQPAFERIIALAPALTAQVEALKPKPAR